MPQLFSLITNLLLQTVCSCERLEETKRVGHCFKYEMTSRVKICATVMQHISSAYISGPTSVFQLIACVLSEFCFVTAKINSIPLGRAPKAVKFTLEASNALVHTVPKFVFSQQTNFHTKCTQIGHQGER